MFKQYNHEKTSLIDLFYFILVLCLFLQRFQNSQLIKRNIYHDKLLKTRKRIGTVSIRERPANWVLSLEIFMINMRLNGSGLLELKISRFVCKHVVGFFSLNRCIFHQGILCTLWSCMYMQTKTEGRDIILIIKNITVWCHQYEMISYWALSNPKQRLIMNM